MDKTFASIAIHLVVENYSDSLIRIAFQYLENISDAEDIVKEVYEKLIKQRKAFRDQRQLKTWLIKETLNKSKDYLSKNEIIILYLFDCHGYTIREIGSLLFIRPKKVKIALENARSKLASSFEEEGVI